MQNNRPLNLTTKNNFNSNKFQIHTPLSPESVAEHPFHLSTSVIPLLNSAVAQSTKKTKFLY